MVTHYQRSYAAIGHALTEYFSAPATLKRAKLKGMVTTLRSLPQEVLESYHDDLLDPCITLERLYLSRSRLLPQASRLISRYSVLRSGGGLFSGRETTFRQRAARTLREVISHDRMDVGGMTFVACA